MSKWTQQMPLVMEIEGKAIAVLGGTTSDVASKTFTKS